MTIPNAHRVVLLTTPPVRERLRMTARRRIGAVSLGLAKRGLLRTAQLLRRVAT